MGHPAEVVTFGVPQRSNDGKLYTLYPQGDAPNAVIAQGGGASAVTSASSASAVGSGLRLPADYFVSAGASGSGDGSFSNPFTPEQARDITHLGRDTYVCWLAGNGGLYHMPGLGHRLSPAWQPNNAGGDGDARIIHFAEHSGAHLSSPFSNSQRTQLSHDGTSGNGRRGPILGSFRDYTIFDGFVLNENEGFSIGDDGVFRAGNADAGFFGIGVRNLAIQGATALTGSPGEETNHAALWFEGVDGVVAENVYVTGLRRLGGAGNPNTSALITYGCRNMAMQNWLVEDCDNGIYIKGSAASGTWLNSGYFRRFIVRNVSGVGIKVQDIDASTPMEIGQGLVHDSSFAVLIGAISGGGAEATIRNIRLRNLTLHASEKTIGVIDNTPYSATNWRIHDNIMLLTSSSGEFVGLAQSTNNHERLDHNLYYNGTSTLRFSKYNAQHVGLSAWRDALTSNGQPVTSRETNSINENPLLDSNYRPQAGSPALTMGSADGIGGTGGEIGAYAGNPTLGIA